MRAVADNDILVKGACYGLLPTFIAAVPGEGRIGFLGASKYVVPNKIMRSGLRGNPSIADAQFTAFIAENEILEPTTDEQEMAAAFEAAAQQMALSLDAGESQLVAMLVSRYVPWLLTGDKRAIASIEKLLDVDPRLETIAGKIRCLERLVADALVSNETDRLRRMICAEPSVDKALTICFSCRSPSSDVTDPLAGLASYIADLRRIASRVLAA